MASEASPRTTVSSGSDLSSARDLAPLNVTPGSRFSSAGSEYSVPGTEGGAGSATVVLPPSVADWSVDDVLVWLASPPLGLRSYGDSFARHKIDGVALLDLTQVLPRALQCVCTRAPTYSRGCHLAATARPAAPSWCVRARPCQANYAPNRAAAAARGAHVARQGTRWRAASGACQPSTCTQPRNRHTPSRDTHWLHVVCHFRGYARRCGSVGPLPWLIRVCSSVRLYGLVLRGHAGVEFWFANAGAVWRLLFWFLHYVHLDCDGFRPRTRA